MFAQVWCGQALGQAELTGVEGVGWWWWLVSHSHCSSPQPEAGSDTSTVGKQPGYEAARLGLEFLGGPGKEAAVGPREIAQQQ